MSVLKGKSILLVKWYGTCELRNSADDSFFWPCDWIVTSVDHALFQSDFEQIRFGRCMQ